MKHTYEFMKDTETQKLIITLNPYDFLGNYGFCHSGIYSPGKHIEKVISKHFNEFYGVDFTYSKIKQCLVSQNHHVKDNNDGTFHLVDDSYVGTLNNRYEDYRFVDATPYDFGRIISIDFETANAKRASVCSIGYVVSENGEVIHSEEILVNPDTDFNWMNISIHGIRPRDVASSDKWDVAWRKVRNFIDEDTLVIGHNLKSMEMACIRQECERYKMELGAFYALDTLHLSKAVNTNLEKHGLSVLAKKYGIDLTHHNALSDANACLEVYNNLTNSVSCSI